MEQGTAMPRPPPVAALTAVASRSSERPVAAPMDVVLSDIGARPVAMKKSAWSKSEDARIVHYQRLYPNKWVTISGFIPGRSDNAIKNRWNTVLCKQQEQDRVLRLFPQASGDVRRFRGEYRPVLDRQPPAEGDDGVEEDDRRRNGACLELLPLKPGDIVRGNPSGAAPKDVNCGAGDPLTVLRLWPRPSTTVAA